MKIIKFSLILSVLAALGFLIAFLDQPVIEKPNINPPISGEYFYQPTNPSPVPYSAPTEFSNPYPRPSLVPYPAPTEFSNPYPRPPCDICNQP